MRTVYFIIVLSFFSIFSLRSQNISGEVEYETSYFQCRHCYLTAKIKSLKSINTISDFKYIPQIYLAALDDEGHYGLLRRESDCPVNGSHGIRESDVPTSEIKKLINIPKERYNGQWLETWIIEKVCKKINSEYQKWVKIYDQEQAKKQLENQIREDKEKKEFENKSVYLETLILDQDFENAAILYTELSNGKFGNDPFLVSQKEIIQNGLNNSNGKVANLTPAQLNDIINWNRASFKELIKDKPETIEIIFDQKGNGFINEKPSKIYYSKPIVLKEIGKFKVYCKSKGTFQLSTEQIQDPNKMYFDIWVSPDLKISKIGNKYFKKTFLSTSVFRDEVSVVNNNQVPNGKYWKVRHDLKIYKVNGTEINREELLIKDSENRLKSRLGMKIARSTGSLAILSWLTFRFIEYSSVK
jgi:hypothetical protein